MNSLTALLAPNAVAVIGASPDPHILRGRTLKVMRRHAYAGRIYPISRSHQEVQGLKAYASIAELPERVDLAVLIIPAQFVPEELERCGKSGVKAALILTSGFAETQGDEGNDLQQQLRDIAQRYDMIVCGPNTEGFANTAAALCPTFSPAVDELAIPLVPEWRTRGHVAVLAQSGGMGFAFFDRGRPKELPFSYIITTGNEACLEGFDVVDYLLDEGHSEVFLMFLENVKSAATFRRVAEKALRAGKPIIVAKVGKSEAGQRAALSHTAALAGAYDIYRAIFRRYGVIEGGDIESMVDIAQAFSFYRDRLPAGVRVGIGTASGGGGGWLADACVAAGLEVPELDAQTRTLIDAHIPAYGTSQNPVDGTAQIIRELGYSRLAEMIAMSDRVDAVIMVITARSVETLERERETLFRLARETRKPILMWSYTNPCAASVRILSEAGIPLFTNMHHCARALRAMADYRTAREAVVHAMPSADTVAAGSVRSLLAEAPRVLCEYRAAEILRLYGVPFPRSQLVQNAQQAASIAASLATPVALKVQSPEIAHKSDAGALVLGLTEPDEIRRGFESILASAFRHAPHANVHGVLVQEMAARGVEMIIGVRCDPLFGPMLMVGFGGIHVEVLRDVAFSPVPISQSQARELLNQLRARTLLDGARGALPGDVDALVDLMVRVAQFATDHADTIDELDLNPVIVQERGHGVTVVDAMMVKSQTRG
jgi:acetate---CoA ligase (ADP-forming)